MDQRARSTLQGHGHGPWSEYPLQPSDCLDIEAQTPRIVMASVSEVRVNSKRGQSTHLVDGEPAGNWTLTLKPTDVPAVRVDSRSSRTQTARPGCHIAAVPACRKRTAGLRTDSARTLNLSRLHIDTSAACRKRTAGLPGPIADCIRQSVSLRWSAFTSPPPTTHPYAERRKDEVDFTGGRPVDRRPALSSAEILQAKISSRRARARAR